MMKTKSNQRPALWNREYETRELNRDGDAVDVSHYATESEAVRAARLVVEAGAPAAVVEYHVTRYKSARADRSETYEEVVAFGDSEALKAFGWEGKVEK
jgi:hypothetical protein